MPTLVAKASSEALAVAVEAAVVNDTTAPHIIGRANRAALGIAGSLSAEALDDELAAMLGAAATAAAAPPAAVEDASEAPTEAEEEEEEEEEAGFGGLGDLFG